MTYYFNIGSNLGDRTANISRAVTEIISRCKAVACRESIPVVSDPWGFSSPNKFINVGLAAEIDMQPLDVLGILHDIENGMGSDSHRSPSGSYQDRIIDIDIMAIDELIVSTDSLSVPHPHLTDRIFFLKPMAELAPDWRHPVLHLTAKQFLCGLRSNN